MNGAQTSRMISFPVKRCTSGGTPLAGALQADVDPDRHPSPRDEWLDPRQLRILPQPVTPIRAVQPRQAADTVRHLLDRHRTGRVTRVATAGDDVFHHHDEVEVRLVDQREVHLRVVERQRRTGREQPRLVEHTARFRAFTAVCSGSAAFTNTVAGPETLRVREPEARPPVRAVVTQLDLDVLHFDAGEGIGQARPSSTPA